MRMRIAVGMLAVAAALVSTGLAGEADPAAQLEETLKAVRSYEYGQDFGPLRQAEQLVIAAAKDPKGRAEAETRLIEALKAAKTDDAKSFLCRQLRTIGTDRAVPELARLLTDDDLSHMARYALGRIDAPEATTALRKAMGKTSGTIQVGIINTLANRDDEKAVPALIKLLKAGDQAVAGAAAAALGRIGGEQAAQALQQARPKAEGKLRERITDGLLACADGFVEAGNPDAASQIYQKFYAAGEPKHVRMAALRGLVSARGSDAAKLLVEAIQSDDAELRAGAIGLVETIKGTEATKTFAALLPKLPPQGQELLLRALGARGDQAAAPAVVHATESEDKNVRAAALKALGSLGDAGHVALLVQAAATGGTAGQMARRSLRRLKGEEVDAALVEAMAKGEPKVRQEAIQALAARGVRSAFDELQAAARADDAGVRREAIRALGTLASPKQLPKLLDLLAKPKEARDRSAVEKAIAAAFRGIEDDQKRAAPLLAALEKMPVKARPTIIRLLGKAPTEKALAAVRKALADENDAARDAAVRTLAQWPNPDPAEDLLKLAQTAPDRRHKVLALRGYVRMAGMSKNPTAMYVRAMKLAERPQDKKLVLGGLGTAGSVEALDLVENYLDDAALKSEAAAAAIQIADKVRTEDEARARKAVKKVLAAVDDPGLRKRAGDVISEIEKFEGYIRTWLIAGPYKEKGKDAGQLFGIAFPPEKPEAEDAKWKKLERGIGSWNINLDTALGDESTAAAYLRTRVNSPKEQKVRLELSSDDAIKAWLNGKEVHANSGRRGIGPAQDAVEVTLQKGWNELLLKVVEYGGGWGAAARVRDVDGTALEGLKFQAKAD